MSESTMVSEFTLPGPKPLKIVVTEGDITEEDSDAIVNAANNHMMGGKGVDGAVHSKAGRQLLEECKKLPVVEPPRTRLRTGDATLLPGFNLKARYVIAAVGPIYHSEALSVPLLQKAFRRVLEIARDRDDIKSVSFPALSCGIFRFPASLAASVFFNEILSAHEETSTAGGIGLEEVRIVLFGSEMFNIWLKTAEDVLREKLKPGSSSTKEDL